MQHLENSLYKILATKLQRVQLITIAYVQFRNSR